MVTLAYAHNAVAAAYMSVFKRMGGILGIPLDGVNVDGATLAGIKVMDDDVFKTVFKGTAYPIPEGETYLLRHQGNGIFTIINQDGHYAGFSVDDNDGSE